MPMLIWTRPSSCYDLNGTPRSDPRLRYWTLGKRADGRYEAKGINPETGARKSYYSRTSQQEADRKATASFGIQPDDTFGSYARLVYIPSVLHRSDNWKHQIAWALDKYILPVFDRRPLAEITRADVQAFVNKLTLSPKSISNLYKVLSAIFKLAAVDEAILRNPCMKIRLPRIEDPEIRPLTFAQLWKLYSNAEPRNKPFILLTGFCGHARGEALGHMWTDLAEGDILKLRYQLLQHKGGRLERTDVLKTPTRSRDLPLPAEMLAELRAHSGHSLWLCPSSDGPVMLPSNMWEEIQLECFKNGFYDEGGDGKRAPWASPHTLRHTFISLMENELEAPQTVIETLTGKASRRRTKGYSKTEIQQLRKWLKRFWDTANASSECLHSDDNSLSSNGRF